MIADAGFGRPRQWNATVGAGSASTSTQIGESFTLFAAGWVSTTVSCHGQSGTT